MNNAYETLFDSIRAKCQQRRWFGTDYDDPHQYDGILEHDPHFDVQSIRIAPLEDPRYTRFAYPPASEELVERSENELGFVLPPLLRALYLEVANGGFGPVSGIRGILDGYGRSGTMYPDSNDTIVARYLWENSSRKVALSYFDGQWSQYKSMYAPTGVWLDKLLPICDMGCVTEVCVANDEQMFLIGAAESDEFYYLAQMLITLEEWLWAWINDDIEIMCRGKYEEQERA